jgi:hypothetical protein
MPHALCLGPTAQVSSWDSYEEEEGQGEGSGRTARVSRHHHGLSSAAAAALRAHAARARGASSGGGGGGGGGGLPAGLVRSARPDAFGPTGHRAGSAGMGPGAHDSAGASMRLRRYRKFVASRRQVHAMQVGVDIYYRRKPLP